MAKTNNKKNATQKAAPQKAAPQEATPQKAEVITATEVRDIQPGDKLSGIIAPIINAYRAKIHANGVESATKRAQAYFATNKFSSVSETLADHHNKLKAQDNPTPILETVIHLLTHYVLDGAYNAGKDPGTYRVVPNPFGLAFFVASFPFFRVAGIKTDVTLADALYEAVNEKPTSRATEGTRDKIFTYIKSGKGGSRSNEAYAAIRQAIQLTLDSDTPFIQYGVKPELTYERDTRTGRTAKQRNLLVESIDAFADIKLN